MKSKIDPAVKERNLNLMMANDRKALDILANKKSTAQDRCYAFMLQGQGLCQSAARWRFGVTDLRDVIARLRKEGHEIHSFRYRARPFNFVIAKAGKEAVETFYYLAEYDEEFVKWRKM